MRRILTLAASLALAGPAAAQQIVSAYTPLDLQKCKQTGGNEEEDYGEWTCRGHEGISVHIAAGDQRIYVSYGRNAKKQPAAKQTLAAFNGEGKTIEWRSVKAADGKLKPFATIMRWSVTKSADEPPLKGEVLVVTRLGPPVCHVGYVDGRANTNANALAQKIADENARNFKCGADKPIVLGEQGPSFSGPYGE
jgi:hypothetical protein